VAFTCTVSTVNIQLVIRFDTIVAEAQQQQVVLGKYIQYLENHRMTMTDPQLCNLNEPAVMVVDVPYPVEATIVRSRTLGGRPDDGIKR